MEVNGCSRERLEFEMCSPPTRKQGSQDCQLRGLPHSPLPVFLVSFPSSPPLNSQQQRHEEVPQVVSFDLRALVMHQYSAP